jgi:hypothetical protein
MLYPSKKRREATKEVSRCVVVAVRAGLFGVSKFGKGEWWEGMYGFPRQDNPPKSAKLIGTLSHTVTNNRIQLSVYRTGAARNVEWKTVAQLGRLAMPSPDRRILRLVLQSIGSKPTGTAKLPSSARK